jgi:hypothetical protein
MEIKSTDEIRGDCQAIAADYCARFWPGLRVIIELADLPVWMLGFSCRSYDAGADCQIVLDKTYIFMCFNRGCQGGISDVIFHELVHCFCIIRGNNSRHDAGHHGAQFSRECNRIGALLGFTHPVRSHRAWKKKRTRNTFDCKNWPFNQRPDFSKHSICRARREAMLKPARKQSQARQWQIGDVEAIIHDLQGIVTLADIVQPQPDRALLAAIITARSAIDDIGRRLIETGLLPRIPVSTWTLTTPKPLSEADSDDEKIKREIEALTNGY